MNKLTSNERVALRHVAQHVAYPAHGNTLRSLERKGAIEHTSIGWRLTEQGFQTLRSLPIGRD